MRTARLRRKLTRWERYARALEKLGQKRLYNAHVYYIARDVLERVRRGRGSSVLVEAKRPTRAQALDEIIWNPEEL